MATGPCMPAAFEDWEDRQSGKSTLDHRRGFFSPIKTKLLTQPKAATKAVLTLAEDKNPRNLKAIFFVP